MSTAIKPQEVEAFRRLLQALQTRLKGDVDQMTSEALQGNSREASGNLSNVPLHLADLGTENFEQEFTLALIENEQATLDQITAALERISKGKFGNCTDCGDSITKQRLQALPYTPFCIDCARRLENTA